MASSTVIQGAACSIEKVASNLPIRLPPLPTAKDLLRLYGLRAQRHLSQNFLLDHNLTNKIAKVAGNLSNCHVCEVGPGPGNITRSILERGAEKVIVIEKDKRFMLPLEYLAEACRGRLKINIGDIMDYNLETIFPKELAKEWNDEPPPLHIIGNLPFNVSTPLIIKWLNNIANQTGPFTFGRVRLTLTFQKEVAERMIAPIFTNRRCRLSIMCQYLCKVKHKFSIPGRAFVPKPDVDVGVVHFIPLKEPLIKLPFKLVERVVKTIFHCRQKYCKYGVGLLFPDSRKELVDEVFKLTEVNPTSRSFHLTVEEIGRICHVYSEICQKYPEIQKYNFR